MKSRWRIWRSSMAWLKILVEPDKPTASPSRHLIIATVWNGWLQSGDCSQLSALSQLVISDA